MLLRSVLPVPAVVTALLGFTGLLLGARRVEAPAPTGSTAPVVDIASVNPGRTVARHLCLSIAAGSDAAYECADLRVSHPLPAVATLNQSRAPLLTYSSQHASPYPLVAAQVTIGATVPDTVIATLAVKGAVRSTGRWLGSSWGPGATRRITIGFAAASSSTWPTGIYPYTLEVTSKYGSTSHPTTATGELVIVNRSASPFGAGWWLAGYEQLLFPADTTQRVWVGGDGSVRRYAKVSPGEWAADGVDRPDTLKWNGSQYVRYLPEGLQVRFDASGYHTSTVNRLGHATTFSHSGGRLDRITLPTHTATAPYYQFNYTSGKLSSVSSPGQGSRRTTTVWNSGLRTDSIQDADGRRVKFTYASNRLTHRTDRRGTVTRYTYAGTLGGRRLTQVQVDTAGLKLTTSFTPAETRAISTGTAKTAVAPNTVHTLLNGPRTNVNDYTRFYLDHRFGAPSRIVDARNHETEILRTDPLFPALVTEVRYPYLEDGTRRIVRASYTARGRIETSQEVDPYGDGADAITHYRYTDSSWPDLVTRIVAPMGDSIVMAYTANGSRSWQQFGAADSTRVTYFYSGPRGLLSSVRLPRPASQGTHPVESYGYDPLGNLHTVTTPLGSVRTHYKDGLGRDTAIVTPMDSVTQKRESIHYDDVTGRGWVRQTVTSAPRRDLTGFHAANTESVTVTNEHDEEGNVEKVVRHLDPNLANLSHLQHQWEYDALGRVTRALHANNSVEVHHYDDALGVDRYRPRGCGGTSCEIVTLKDVLGRDSVRIVPARTFAGAEPRFPLDPDLSSPVTIAPDTLRFTYDAMGNLRTADNRDARISRSYFRNGLLQTDSTWHRAYEGQNFGSGYHTRMVYDLNGRRTQLWHPGSAHVQYDYDPLNGQLGGINDVGGRTYTFSYDAQGNPWRITLPGNLVDERRYDLENRVRERTVTNYRAVTMSYDASGRLTYLSSAPGPFRASYTGLGAVIRGIGVGREVQAPPSDNDSPPMYYSVDPLGNVVYSKRPQGDRSEENESWKYYNVLGAVRGTETREPVRPDGQLLGYRESERVDNSYDSGGNLKRVSRMTGITVNRSDPFDYEEKILEDTDHYYGWDGRLRVVDQDKCWYQLYPETGGSARCVHWDEPENEYEPVGTFEEYRYDALGRRIMLRSRPQEGDPDGGGGDEEGGEEEEGDSEGGGGGGGGSGGTGVCTERCRPHFDRYVWDGDQLLFETRDRNPTGSNSGDYYGTVTYTHGPGLDAPVSLLHNGVGTIVLHANRQGLPDMGTYPSGSRLDPTQHFWAGLERPIYPMERAYPVGSAWLGSLIRNKTDASGLIYMRNRYYDPVSGQFTQEDPIGLGGGLNLYGYANGDPVTYSDPFGLSPSCEPNCPDPALLPLGVGEAVILGRGLAALGDAIGAFGDVIGTYFEMRAATREHNLIGTDKYYHCLANCRGAQKGRAGAWVAERFSNFREVFDQRVKGYPREDSLEDQEANRQGRQGGSEDPNRPCTEVCESRRPRGLPSGGGQ